MFRPLHVRLLNFFRLSDGLHKIKIAEYDAMANMRPKSGARKIKGPGGGVSLCQPVPRAPIRSLLFGEYCRLIRHC
jgi:hypothetical protein